MRVPQSIRNRRIRNELARLPMSYDFSGNIVTVGENPPIRLRLDVNEKHVIELSLDLFSSWMPGSINMKVLMPVEKYPFEPPTLKINNQKIDKIHRKLMKTKYFNEIIKKRTGNTCLCCVTILSKSKWMVLMGVKDIIKEVIFLGEIHQKNVEMLHMERVIAQKLKIDFNYLLEFVI